MHLFGKYVGSAKKRIFDKVTDEMDFEIILWYIFMQYFFKNIIHLYVYNMYIELQWNIKNEISISVYFTDFLTFVLNSTTFFVCHNIILSAMW